MLWIAEGDARARWLARLALEKGIDARYGGLPPYNCDRAALPLPDSGRASREGLESIARGARVLLGRADDALLSLARTRGWHLIRAYEDAEYIEKNALVTAEGALHAAMTHSARALYCAKCGVIGPGRIGGRLAVLLRALGAETVVFARGGRPGCIPMEQMPDAISDLDVLFNTAPARVLNEEALARMKKGALLIDLASAPYGFDLEAASRCPIVALRESGLPGRYAPQTEAEALLALLEEGDAHE